MVTYRATKALSVEMISTREQFIGANGEDHCSACDVEDVAAGDLLTPDQVIAATQSFFDKDGHPTVFTNENGLILSEIDDEVAATVQTQLDVWLADGSIEREQE